MTASIHINVKTTVQPYCPLCVLRELCGLLFARTDRLGLGSLETTKKRRAKPSSALPNPYEPSVSSTGIFSWLQADRTFSVL